MPQSGRTGVAVRSRDCGTAWLCHSLTEGPRLAVHPSVPFLSAKGVVTSCLTVCEDDMVT